MLAYIIRRILTMFPMLLAISFISFVIIQLPPGDYLNTLQAVQGSSGGGMIRRSGRICCASATAWTSRCLVQYWKWISGLSRRGFRLFV